MVRLIYGLRLALKDSTHTCNITNLSKIPRLWIPKQVTNKLPKCYPESHVSEATVAKFHLMHYDYRDFILTTVYESDSLYYGYTYWEE